MKFYIILSGLLVFILIVLFTFDTKPATTADISMTGKESILEDSVKPVNTEPMFEKAEPIPDIEKLEPVITPTAPKPIKTEEYGYLPLDNNVFGITILAGYYLNSVPNARLAAQILNETVIYPGQTFSFNKTVGNRTSERGFVSGTVIMGDQYVPGVGGGVCRASTAMYNIAQVAQLPVLQRTSHTLPTPYASRGRDAAVWWPDLDLQFLNNKEYPIEIKTLEQEGKLYFGLMLMKPVETKDTAEPLEQS